MSLERAEPEPLQEKAVHSPFAVELRHASGGGLSVAGTPFCHSEPEQEPIQQAREDRAQCACQVIGSSGPSVNRRFSLAEGARAEVRAVAAQQVPFTIDADFDLGEAAAPWSRAQGISQAEAAQAPDELAVGRERPTRCRFLSLLRASASRLFPYLPNSGLGRSEEAACGERKRAKTGRGMPRRRADPPGVGALGPAMSFASAG